LKDYKDFKADIENISDYQVILRVKSIVKFIHKNSDMLHCLTEREKIIEQQLIESLIVAQVNDYAEAKELENYSASEDDIH